MAYPFLALKDITIDLKLVGRVPSYLAYYHLAIPIAEENNRVTMVMAYPDNPNVIKLFANLFGAEIFPVRGNDAEIRSTLEILYPHAEQASAKRFLCWSHTEPTQSLHYVQNMAMAFQAEALNASHNSLESLLNIAREGGYFRLIAVDVAEAAPAKILLQEGRSSLLLLRGQYPPPQHILIALQGHSPDHEAIQTGLTLAQHFGASITLLGIAAPMKRHQIQGIATLLDPAEKAGQHLQNCMEQLQGAGGEHFLKLRQGIPAEQVALEFTGGGYDLMLIPVETFGNFVYRVLEQIEAYSPQQSQPILAVKPAR